MEALAEIKTAIDGLGRTHNEFKKTVDDQIADLKKRGTADPLLEEKIKKLDAALTEFGATKERLEKIEVSLKRSNKPGSIRLKDRITGEESDAPEDWAEAKEAYSKFLRKGDGGRRDQGGDVFDYQKKTLSVQSDSDGGFLVTADMGGRIVQRIFETSPVEAVASVQMIGTDRLEGTYDDNEASAAWVSEQGTRSQTNTPAIGKWMIPVHELYAMPAATQRLLDDANIAIEPWLAGKVADKFARTCNTAYVLGTGIGQPRGFLTYTAGTTLRTTIQQVNSGTSAVITGDGLFSLVYSLKAGYRARAQFAMNRTSISQARKIKDGEDRYLWEPSLQMGEPARLLGYGIQEFNDMPDPAADSLSVAFADWAEFYQIVKRAGIRVLRDPYTSKGFVLFYTTMRVGGDVLNTEAGKIQKLAT